MNVWEAHWPDPWPPSASWSSWAATSPICVTPPFPAAHQSSPFGRSSALGQNFGPNSHLSPAPLEPVLNSIALHKIQVQHVSISWMTDISNLWSKNVENEDKDYGCKAKHFDEEAEFLAHAFTFHSFLIGKSGEVVENWMCVEWRRSVVSYFRQEYYWNIRGAFRFFLAKLGILSHPAWPPIPLLGSWNAKKKK